MNKCSFYRVFKPTLEEQLSSQEHLLNLENKLSKDRSCTTCYNCVDADIPPHPDFVTVEESICAVGLKCDTVTYSVKNCPKYVHDDVFTAKVEDKIRNLRKAIDEKKRRIQTN